MHPIGNLPDPKQLPAIWSELDEGVRSGNHPFHHTSLATIRVSQSGQMTPEQRTVVLRGVIPAEWRFVIHTDRRSNKAADITTTPAVSLLFYDFDGRWQLRVRGTATMEIDTPLSVERWAKVPERSRLCYRTPRAPGTLLSATPSGGPQPTSDGSDAFALIVVEASQIEALFLDHRRHRRLLWSRDDVGRLPVALEP